MSIQDMGRRMSAHELTVIWPEYMAWKDREQKRRDEKEERKGGRRR